MNESAADVRIGGVDYEVIAATTDESGVVWATVEEAKWRKIRLNLRRAANKRYYTGDQS